MRDRGAAVAEPFHVVIVEPDAVRDGEIGAEDAELVEMRSQGLAVELDAGKRLHLRLGDMAVQPDAEITGDRGASPDELVRAVMRDGRRDCGTDMRAIEGPVAERRARRGEGCLAGREPERFDALLQGIGKRVHQARDRLEKGAVGDHRRDDCAHADLLIGRGDEADAVAGRQRKFDKEIIGGGAALQHHLDGTELRRQVDVVLRAVARQPGRGGQQQFEGPAVAHALGEIAVRVGVGVDEAGMNELAFSRDDGRVFRRGEAGRADLGDRVVADQDVGRRGRALLDVEHPAAADYRVGHPTLLVFGRCTAQLIPRDAIEQAATRPGRSVRRRARIPAFARLTRFRNYGSTDRFLLNVPSYLLACIFHLCIFSRSSFSVHRTSF